MNSVNYKTAGKSLTDVIQEAQLKIGYDHHPITLYYPTESVRVCSAHRRRTRTTPSMRSLPFPRTPPTHLAQSNHPR